MTPPAQTGHFPLDRHDLCLQHCADLGIDVEWADLGERRRGEYRRSTNLIVLSTLLTRRQATATLSHELGHARFGDTCSTPATESRAWQYGAALIITPGQYAAAEQLVGSHPSALAAELEVTPRLIGAWRTWWERRGRDTHQRAAGAPDHHQPDTREA